MRRTSTKAAAVERAILFFALTVLALPLPRLFAEPIASLHPSNYVNDFAHVLAPQTESALDDLCRQVDEKAHAQIAVVTINTLDGQDIESYAVKLYQTWGIGNKSTNRGVLLLIAIKDHRYRTEVGYGLEPILPDGKVGGFWRQVVPLLKQSNYDEALQRNTQDIAQVIAQDAGVQLTGITADQGDREPQRLKGIPVGGIVIFVIVVLLLLGTPLRSIFFWWLLFGGGGRGGRGGWGGGGFGGGGGGGGGFGGFGGGMSGGGGASGSW